MMNINIFENTQDNTFRFEIANDKKVILMKRGLPNKAACLSAIKKTLNTIFNNDMINVSSTKGGFIFQAHNTISRTFKSLEQASDAIAFLKEEGWKNKGNFKVQFESRKSEVISKKRLGTINEGYDFKQASKTKKQGFELLDKEKEQLFYFHLNDSEGKPMLFSRAFDGKRQRIKAAKGITEFIKEKKASIKVIPFRGNFMFIIKDIDGYEIARSKTFKTKKAAEEGINFLKKETKGKLKIFKLPKKKKKPLKLPKERYLLQQIAPKGNIGFEAFRNKTNKAHYFHYHDAKRKALLVSPAYDSRRKRDAAIERIVGLSQNKEHYVMKEKGDKHYFTLVTEKGKTIARSRFFDTKRDMILGMKHFLNKAPSYLDQKNTISANQLESIPISVNAGRLESENSGSVPEKRSNKPVEAKKTAPRSNEPPKEKIQPPKKTVQRKQVRNTNRKDHPPKTNPPKKTKVVHQQNNRTAKKPPLKEVAPTRRSTTKITPSKIKVIPPKTKSSRPISKAQTDAELGSNSTKWWRWIPILLFALLAFFLWKNCTGAAAEKSPAVVEEVPPQKNVKPVKEDPVKKLPTLLGPNGKELGFTKGGQAAKIANFLSLPESVFPETFLLDKVHFDTNSDILKREANPQLDNIVSILKSYSTAQSQINGHTDAVGNPQKNLQLSSARALKVKKYLVDNGIAGDRIATKGFGATQPLSSNQTESGKYKNRRSEIVLLRRE